MNDKIFFDTNILLYAHDGRDPYTGRGKPEPLKHLPGNIWSRRITQEDRLVYRVYSGKVDFLQANYHY